jgi:uncharacterized protein YcbK (DUF882 family)
MTSEAICRSSAILDRRTILKTGLAVCVGGAISGFSKPALAAMPAVGRDTGVFTVSFRNMHTDESFSGVYRVGHKYLPEAFERINLVLRDFRSGDVFPIDPRTIDLLSVLQQKAGANTPFDVLSGYRSPKTNMMLRASSEGVARRSLHMTGQAVDLHIPNYSLAQLRDVARSLRMGGVGYYPKSNFVHVDTGQVRHW